MNMLPGDILTDISERLEIPDVEPGKVVCGLRPEHLEITSPQEGLLSGKVRMVGSQGSEKIVYVTVGDHEVLAKTSPDSSVSESDEIGLRFESTRLYFFDRNSGERIR